LLDLIRQPDNLITEAFDLSDSPAEVRLYVIRNGGFACKRDACVTSFQSRNAHLFFGNLSITHDTLRNTSSMSLCIAFVIILSAVSFMPRSYASRISRSSFVTTSGARGVAMMCNAVFIAIS
jgi:hypothetical protein